MKPEIGQKVYCVYRSVLGSCIIGTTVAFIGKDSFITNEFGKEQECFNNKFPEQLQAKLVELKGGKQ